jgi:chromosome segregation ATPase
VAWCVQATSGAREEAEALRVELGAAQASLAEASGAHARTQKELLQARYTVEELRAEGSAKDRQLRQVQESVVSHKGMRSALTGH